MEKKLSNLMGLSSPEGLLACLASKTILLKRKTMLLIMPLWELEMKEPRAFSSLLRRQPLRATTKKSSAKMCRVAKVQSTFLSLRLYRNQILKTIC